MNKAAMIEAVENDGALISSSVCDTSIKRCGHAGHCAVGALLFHAGMNNRELKALANIFGAALDGIWTMDEESGWYSRKEIELTKRAVHIFRHKYDMTYDDMAELMGYNDEDAVHCAAKRVGKVDEHGNTIDMRAHEQDKLRAAGVIEFIKNGLKMPKDCYQ